MYIDILVFGKDQEEHNPNLRAVFKQPRKLNTLNKGKCDYGKKKFQFLGHVFPDDGISPDPNNVEGVVILKHQALRLKYKVC